MRAPRTVAAGLAAFTVALGIAIASAPAMAAPAAASASVVIAQAATPAVTLSQVLKPWGGTWCSRYDMGGQLIVYTSGVHSTRGLLEWQAATTAKACAHGTTYPKHVWVQFMLSGHTATKIYGKVVGGNKAGLALLPKGMKIAFENRTARHISIAPPGLQPGHACRMAYANSAYCKE